MTPFQYWLFSRPLSNKPVLSVSLSGKEPSDHSLSVSFGNEYRQWMGTEFGLCLQARTVLHAGLPIPNCILYLLWYKPAPMISLHSNPLEIIIFLIIAHNNKIHSFRPSAHSSPFGFVLVWCWSFDWWCRARLPRRNINGSAHGDGAFLWWCRAIAKNECLSFRASYIA